MADSRTFQEFLNEQRITNEQLASLRKENVLMGQLLADIRRDAMEDSTSRGYIESALPEILNERQLYKKQKADGAFEVDDTLKDLIDVNLLGFDALLDVMESSAEFDRVQAFREKREELASGQKSETVKASDDEEVDGEKAGELATTGILAGLTGGLTGAGLMTFGLAFGKGLLKGGLFGGIGLLVGNYLADNVDDEFLKEGLSKGVPAAAIGSAFGGLPGALAGIAITGLGGMVDFLSGKSDELSNYDFASFTLGTAGAAYFAKSKITALLTAGKGGVPVKLGAALLSTPVLIAGGIGIALGVGARFIANKMDEYQDKTLDQAKKITDTIDKDLGEAFAKSETKLLERLGFSFGQGESETGTIRQASTEGVEEFRKQGELSVDTAQTMSDTAESLMNISDEFLETILQDKVKAKNLLTTLQNLTVLAVEDQISTSTEDILLLQSRVAEIAEGLDEEGLLANLSKAYDFDILSQIADLEADIKAKKDEIATSDFEPGSMARKALEKQLRDLNDDMNELSLVPSSMGLDISVKDIIDDVGAGRLQDLIAQEIKGEMPLINTSLQADDAIIESADVDLKNAFIRMNDGLDMAKDLEMAIANAGSGSFVNTGGNTTAISSSNSFIIAPSVTPNGKTEAKDKTIN